MSKPEDYINYVDSDRPEFNMMALYMVRVDKRSDERDMALNQGDLEAYYRTTMTLLMNVIPRFRHKDMPPDKIEDLKEALLKIGGKLKNMAVQSQNIQKKNKIQYEEELFEYNIRLNSVMFDYGLIYPISEKKTITEAIREGFS